MDISRITASDLQDDIIDPIFIKEYREQVTKRMKDDKYMFILSTYVDSVFQDFESSLRTQIGLVEDDVRLVLDEYNSSFIIYELTPVIYTFKDLYEALFNILQSECPGSNNVIAIKFDNITTKNKLVVNFGNIAIRFDEKSFFSTIIGCTPVWDYKHYNEYISQKIVNLNSTNKKHLKCDIIDGAVVNGYRPPIMYSFVLDKPSGYKVFREIETIHLKKISISVLNTITFYFEECNSEKVNFNNQTLTFTLQMIKIGTNLFTFTYTCFTYIYIYFCYKWVIIKLSLILTVLVVDIDLVQ